MTLCNTTGAGVPGLTLNCGCFAVLLAEILAAWDAGLLTQILSDFVLVAYGVAKQEVLSRVLLCLWAADRAFPTLTPLLPGCIHTYAADFKRREEETVRSTNAHSVSFAALHSSCDYIVRTYGPPAKMHTLAVIAWYNATVSETIQLCN